MQRSSFLAGRSRQPCLRAKLTLLGPCLFTRILLHDFGFSVKRRVPNASLYSKNRALESFLPARSLTSCLGFVEFYSINPLLGDITFELLSLASTGCGIILDNYDDVTNLGIFPVAIQGQRFETQCLREIKSEKRGKR